MACPKYLFRTTAPSSPNKKLQKFCKELNIHQIFTSVEHPQTNGQVEAANKVILTELKKRLN